MHLSQNRINFDSLNDLIAFQNDYSATRQQAILNQRSTLLRESEALRIGVVQLEDEIKKCRSEIEQKSNLKINNLKLQLDKLTGVNANALQMLTYKIRALLIQVKIKYQQILSELIIYFWSRLVRKQLSRKRERLKYLDSNFEEAVRKEIKVALLNLDRKKRAIDDISPSIYGAIGEQKVVKELEQLSDEFILINDFTFSFTKAIYYSQTKEYIKSVQIDHLLISPSGIFLIETKNWTKQSWLNSGLRSPIQQIKRSSFALFIIVSNYSNLTRQWSGSKIPIRNIIATMGYLPTEEFQYLKILPLDKLAGYIKYFKPSLSNQERENLVNFFLGIRT
ncbi:MAG: NERD domain-containing protein [Cyclobacteriaceae bacterium]|nr:NERD domain-containing protein [Cyclobacteriaceae bacterium]